MPLQTQVALLFILAIPIACISWTVTHEEVFREPREYCVKRSEEAKTLLERKFFYLFTCEYCFSHYVTIGLLIITHFTMIFDDWRGYLISGFSLVWIANVYMSLYNLIRIDIKKEKTIIKEKEQELNE
jgi:cytochrome c oxidase assembly factor CtaG